MEGQPELLTLWWGLGLGLGVSALLTWAAAYIFRRRFRERMQNHLDGEAARWERYAKATKNKIVANYMLNVANNLREIAQKYKNKR